ncbi:MAG: hypothetical protein GKR94_30165 [Gammaproteobacteria bacterium]|nr:hypothetical protein [Gammaproteobacteria bacterium]
MFLAPGARRAEVVERIGADGKVLTDPDESTVLHAFEKLCTQGVESVAVVVLFSFLNPAHEQRSAALAAAHFPHLSLSLSSAVDRAFREYERTVVTGFDAYTKPVLTRYLRNLEDVLRQQHINAPFQVMQSRGGVSAASSAVERPVRLFLSGPAAGVIGAGQTGTEAGHQPLITVDIGGTRCDIALLSLAANRWRGQRAS